MPPAITHFDLCGIMLYSKHHRERGAMQRHESGVNFENLIRGLAEMYPQEEVAQTLLKGVKENSRGLDA